MQCGPFRDYWVHPTIWGVGLQKAEMLVTKVFVFSGP